jgi:hypothetical protein
VVLDIDEQAFTVATVAGVDGQAQLLDVRVRQQLGWHAWCERVLNAIADCCILDSRWDPRESPTAEQALFDQLEEVFEAAQQGKVFKLVLETPRRYHNLVLRANEVAGYCAALRRQLLVDIEAIMVAPWPGGAPGVLLVTAGAARIPGLVADLQARMPAWAGPAARQANPTKSALEDFGTHLLDEPADAGSVVVLSADAPARGAHAMAAYFQRGDIPCGHLHAAAPLPLPQPLEAGPPRLHFQGRDYLLHGGSFVIGRQPGSDLVCDAELWPKVAARHCEIIYLHRTHVLCDRSKDGTLINDRPATQAIPLQAGDWIRLGPEGPLLRYLGQSNDLRTTA